MSIFWLGGPPEKVPEESILPDMYEDRYFLPGIIHGGEDYLIRVYLNDSHCEAEDDNLQFEVDYITRDIVLKAKAQDPSLGDDFYDALLEAENFAADNDGSSGEFAAIVSEWPKSVYLTHSELVKWAEEDASEEAA